MNFFSWSSKLHLYYLLIPLALAQYEAALGMVEENQCLDQILSQIESDIIEEVAVVSTSEVEGLGDSGILYVCTCKCFCY